MGLGPNLVQIGGHGQWVSEELGSSWTCIWVRAGGPSLGRMTGTLGVLTSPSPSRTPHSHLSKILCISGSWLSET